MQQLINEKNLSKILGKSLQTLRNDRFLRRGVPYFKVGRSVRYSTDDVKNYLEKSRIDFKK
jgi:phage terminase Nu1 subunit (DNA packaging protein)